MTGEDASREAGILSGKFKKDYSMEVKLTNGQKYLVPDFFVLGAAKAGTTNMHTYLSQHPSIKMPGIKESWFFSSYVEESESADHAPVYPGGITSIQEYADLFSGATECNKLGDCSPSYLYSYEQTITNIKKIYHDRQKWKDLKFIISLRNPIERAWSQYWTMREGMREPLPFEEAILHKTIQNRLQQQDNPFYDYIGFGNYMSQIQAYQKAFGKNNVRIYLFEDWKKDQIKVCKDIFSFISIDDSFTPTKKGTIQNSGGKPRVPALNKFVLKPNPVKTLLKQTIGAFMSSEMRLKTKHYIVKSTVEKVEMPSAIRSVLIKKYTNEINSLQAYLDIDLQPWLSKK